MELLLCMLKGNNMRILFFILILLAFINTRFAYTNPDVTAQQTLSQITQPIQPSLDAKLPSPAKKNEPIKLNNAHEVEQKVIITQPKKDPTDCTQLHGKEFMECMACQSSENLKKNIQNSNDRMAHYYFVNLPLEEYHEALQNFNEKEWDEFYTSRKRENQENFPRTLHEQRVMLKKIYLEAYFYHSLERRFSGQSELKPDDLEKVIQNFRARCECGWVAAGTGTMLHDKFYHFRKKLFTKPAR